MVEEEAEYQQDDYDVIAQNSPPGCYFGGDIGHKAEKTSMRQNTISINSGGTTKITPVSTKGTPHPRKPVRVHQEKKAIMETHLLPILAWHVGKCNARMTMDSLCLWNVKEKSSTQLSTTQCRLQLNR
jgi:hypothetical protein